MMRRPKQERVLCPVRDGGNHEKNQLERLTVARASKV
jgi:hypothetical protein